MSFPTGGQGLTVAARRGYAIRLRRGEDGARPIVKARPPGPPPSPAGGIGGAALPHRSPTPAERAHLAGLTTVARHGPSHMARIGAAGQDSLSRRIAEEFGIPPDAQDYLPRLEAARRLYFARLRSRRSAAVNRPRP